MKHTLVLLVILALLAMILYFFSVRNPEQNNFGKISIDEPDKIDVIELKNMETGEKISLGTKKMLLNNSIQAKKTAVYELLRIASELKIRNTASNNIAEKLIEEINEKGTQVTFFADNKIVYSYKVSTATKYDKGTYILNQQNELPVIVYIPGFLTDISPFFSTDVYYWSENTLFNLKPSEIQSIRIKNYASPDTDFSLILTESGFEVKDTKGSKIKKFDKDAVIQYLSYFQNISFNGIIRNLSPEKVDSVVRSKPESEIIVKPVNKPEIKIRVFSNYNPETGKIDMNQALIQIDNKTNLFAINYTELDLICKEIKYFMLPEK